jgi:lysine 2,3-aminomutase
MNVNLESRIRSDELNVIAEKNAKYPVKNQENNNKRRKEKLLLYFNATETDWNNFHWQMKNRISNAKQLNDIFKLSKERFKEIDTVGTKYAWSVSPYYLSLINVNNILDPIGLMAIPNILEMEDQGETDPMNEKYMNPAPLITRRYPDRVIVNTTNICGTYCRFCQRKRNIRSEECMNARDSIDETINFIKKNKYIRDVVITGGDPLTLSNDSLENILIKVRHIEHVEIIRIGSRIPVTIPQRIDNKLTNILKKYHPLYMNVHVNHPQEITEDSIKGCNRLADAGIPLGNQMVLLNGVNNNKYVVLDLNKKLLKCRVKPYYIFFSKNVRGTTHFNCNIKDGIDIIDFLRGNVSGLAVPTYIVNAPKGFGKVPILSKNYVINDGEIELTTWENRKISFKNPESKTISERYQNNKGY